MKKLFNINILSSESSSGILLAFLAFAIIFVPQNSQAQNFENAYPSNYDHPVLGFTRYYRVDDDTAIESSNDETGLGTSGNALNGDTYERVGWSFTTYRLTTIPLNDRFGVLQRADGMARKSTGDGYVFVNPSILVRCLDCTAPFEVETVVTDGGTRGVAFGPLRYRTDPHRPIFSRVQESRVTIFVNSESIQSDSDTVAISLSLRPEYRSPPPPVGYAYARGWLPFLNLNEQAEHIRMLHVMPPMPTPPPPEPVVEEVVMMPETPDPAPDTDTQTGEEDNMMEDDMMETMEEETAEMPEPNPEPESPSPVEQITDTEQEIRVAMNNIGENPETPHIVIDENINEMTMETTNQQIDSIPTLSHRADRSGSSNRRLNYSFTADDNSMHAFYENENNYFNYDKTHNNESLDFETTLAYKGIRINDYTLPDMELWIDFAYSKGESENNDNTGESYYLHFGTDFSYGENLIIGIMAQLDQSEYETVLTQQNTSISRELETQGFLVGPYILANIGYGMNFESKLAYGESENEFKDFAIANNAALVDDEFDSERLLFTASLARDYDYEEYILTPRIEYSRFSNTRESFVITDTQIMIPENKLELNRFAFSVSASKDFKYNGIKITPTLTASGFYDEIDNEDTTTGRIDGRVVFYGRNNIDWHLGGHYDVITDDENLQTYSISGGLIIRF